MTSPISDRPGAVWAQTVDVETPELVVLTYTIAGIGSRVVAALIDYLICGLGFVAVLVGLASLGSRGLLGGPGPGAAWGAALLYLLLFGILWGYYVLFEGLADGQTPGKRLMRLRVVRDGGYSVTFGASAARNLVRILDMQPVLTYGIAIASVLFTRRGKRLGDLAAGTIVVREALATRATPAALPASVRQERGGGGSEAPIHARLTNEEFAVLERFAERRAALSTERRNALAEQLAARLAPAMESVPGATPLIRVLALLEAERHARSHGAVAIRERGAARERHAIIASSSQAWNAFAARVGAAQRGGLKRLSEGEVRDFVESYRDAANDLARLRTATGARGHQDADLFFLARLVASAHNLLYRGASLTWDGALKALAVSGPREVRRSWRPILLAALTFFGPAAIAHVAVVRQPDVAETFLPPGMLDRAEEGVERARRG
ncbi:MAG: RDD family protein, partial [Gemmatimonadaceae bacterium]